MTHDFLLTTKSQFTRSLSSDVDGAENSASNFQAATSVPEIQIACCSAPMTMDTHVHGHLWVSGTWVSTDIVVYKCGCARTRVPAGTGVTGTGSRTCMSADVRLRPHRCPWTCDRGQRCPAHGCMQAWGSTDMGVR